MSKPTTTKLQGLEVALSEQAEGLANCVHCGFCLPVCPTYRRLGDEADSPRGRLHLMKAVVEGRMDPGADAFQIHIDRCLGCRACEPVCPSGVEYGHMLELAREVATSARPPALPTRLLLVVFSSSVLSRAFLFGSRLFRASGLPRRAVRTLPKGGKWEQLRLGMAMLAASAPTPLPNSKQRSGPPAKASVPTARGGRVALLHGCVQKGLFGRVNKATKRVLRVNGYEVVRVSGQGCCGALHAHGGALDTARSLAKKNIQAFESSGVEYIVINSSGCGAAMADYSALFSRDENWAERAKAVADRVVDVSELLARQGPRQGGVLNMTVAYDAPCHLVHAMRVEKEPLQVLGAIPGLEVTVLPSADECCGGAGIYGITHPELGGRIGNDKVDDVVASDTEVLATGNPGCMMQIGGGLRLRGDDRAVVHPVELLDESYERGGLYR